MRVAQHAYGLGSAVGRQLGGAAIIVAAAVTVGLVVGCGDTPVPIDGVGGGWTLKFRDEFNATRLNLHTWQPNWLGPTSSAVTSPPNGHDINCVSPGQVAQDHGYLRLTATPRPCETDQGQRYQWASGLVTTARSYRFRYGLVVARMYLPGDSRGFPVNFPALWANGTGHWPSTGEMDVMEVLRSCGRGLSYHFHSLAGDPGGCARTRRPTGWHTFAADWRPGIVTYYYDGERVGQITAGVTDSPMYLVLDNCVNPTFAGASAPATVLVDYIRVYQ